MEEDIVNEDLNTVEPEDLKDDNITIIDSTQETSENTISTIPDEYLDFFPKIKDNTIHIYIDIIILEFLLNNYPSIILPVLSIIHKSDYTIKMNIINMIQVYDNEIVTYKIGNIDVNGIYFKWPPIEKEKKKHNFLYFIVKKNIESYISEQIYIFKSKDKTLDFLSFIYNLLTYYFTRYNYSYLFNELFDISSLIKNINLLTFVENYKESNTEIINYLKDFNIPWIKYTKEYNTTFLNDMFNSDLLILYIKLFLSNLKSKEIIEFTNDYIKYYNSNINSKYYSSKINVLKYITEKEYSRYLKLSVKSVSPLLREINSILKIKNTVEKIKQYEKFIKKYNIEESNVNMIYDTENNELICPHIRDSVIYNKKDIEDYYILISSMIYCKICGSLIKEFMNLAINVKEEIALYKSADYAEKTQIWSDVIKVLVFIKINEDVVILFDLMKQITNNLYSKLQVQATNIRNIKTLSILNKNILTSTINNIYIWGLFTLLRKKYPALIDITITEKKEKNIENAVLEKILMLYQNSIKQHSFITVEKIKEYYFNSLLALQSVVDNIKIKEKPKNQENIYLINNILYNFLSTISSKETITNAVENINIEQLQRVDNAKTKDEITYNLLLDFADFIKLFIYQNDTYNISIVEKINSIPVTIVNPIYVLHHKFSSEQQYFKYIQDYKYLNILYGVNKQNIFHEHKWFIENNTLKCKICQTEYTKLNKEFANIIDIIHLQLLIYNFYKMYFILCPIDNYQHEFDNNWVCTKCKITTEIIMNKNIDYFNKYVKLYEEFVKKEKNKILLLENMKYIMEKKNIDDSEYKKKQTTDVYDIVQKTKQYITFMDESIYMKFLLELGLAKTIPQRCDKLNYFIQSIMCIMQYFSIKHKEYMNYNYNILKTNYDFNVLQYILLNIIYDFLLTINNKECFIKIIKMILNYEKITKTSREAKEYIIQFNIKEDNIETNISEDLYENIDYEEIDEDYVEED